MIPEVFTTGPLSYVTFGASSDANSRIIGLFKPSDTRHILTPVLCANIGAHKTDLFLKTHKHRPHSWAVETINDSDDGSVICHGRGSSGITLTKSCCIR
jgi:hypothetical protein